MKLNKNGESGHPCVIPDLRVNTFSFSALSIMVAVGQTGSCSALVDGAMLSKSLIQFSTGGWSCVPSL